MTATTVRIAVVADPHVSVERDEPARWHNDFRLADSYERLESALRHPLVEGADVFALLGDLAHFGDRASMDAVAALADQCPVPVVLVSGNHDVQVDGVRPRTTG